ncbi:MotA/TolQ/ExbB proton channel family protein [Cerasicoccus frondis]|uniref:MotA/TolQ/ExbB proton channel family protein n=1 Tax=Cerasicoccus frondis TaxID=490090 RepID=UPI002852B64E|nr:MotA/TolQ/ExbB proton channel family protein [Cerasicoccus frondis]
MAQLTTFFFGYQAVIDLNFSGRNVEINDLQKFRCQRSVAPNDAVKYSPMNNESGKSLAQFGAWMQLGPVIGLIGTIIGMLGAFKDISDGGMGEPEALADSISLALVTTAIGLVLGLIGIVLLAIALFGCRYRAPWFYTFLLVISIIWMLNFPIGTILGVLLLLYILNRKDEFQTQPPTLS